MHYSPIALSVTLLVFSSNSCEEHKYKEAINLNHLTNQNHAKDQEKALFLKRIKNDSSYYTLIKNDSGSYEINKSHRVDKYLNLENNKELDIFLKEGADAIFIIIYEKLDFRAQESESTIEYLPVYDGNVTFSFAEVPYTYSINELFHD